MEISTEQKLVTIIVPAYNVENYIEECLNSIINQTYHSIEVLVVDDGSTDNTYEVIKNVAGLDARIKPFTKPNSGVSDTRNFALKQAMGTYIQFVDGDDTLEPTAVEALVNAIENEYDFVNCMYNRIDEAGKLDKEQYSFCNKYIALEDFEDTVAFIKDELMPYHVGFEVWDKLFKTDIIKSHNITFNKDCHIGEDLAFIINYSFYAKNINCIGERLYNYRLRGNSAMQTANDFTRNFVEHMALAEGLKKEYAKWPNANADFGWLYSIIMKHAYEGHTAAEIVDVLSHINDSEIFIREIEKSANEATDKTKKRIYKYILSQYTNDFWGKLYIAAFNLYCKLRGRELIQNRKIY